MRSHTSIWFFSGILLLCYGVIIRSRGCGSWGIRGRGAGAVAAAPAHLVGRDDDGSGAFYTIRFRATTEVQLFPKTL